MSQNRDPILNLDMATVTVDQMLTRVIYNEDGTVKDKFYYQKYKSVDGDHILQGINNGQYIRDNDGDYVDKEDSTWVLRKIKNTRKIQQIQRKEWHDKIYKITKRKGSSDKNKNKNKNKNKSKNQDSESKENENEKGTREIATSDKSSSTRARTGNRRRVTFGDDKGGKNEKDDDDDREDSPHSVIGDENLTNAQRQKRIEQRRKQNEKKSKEKEQKSKERENENKNADNLYDRIKNAMTNENDENYEFNWNKTKGDVFDWQDMTYRPTVINVNNTLMHLSPGQIGSLITRNKAMVDVNQHGIFLLDSTGMLQVLMIAKEVYNNEWWEATHPNEDPQSNPYGPVIPADDTPTMPAIVPTKPTGVQSPQRPNPQMPQPLIPQPTNPPAPARNTQTGQALFDRIREQHRTRTGMTTEQLIANRFIPISRVTGEALNKETVALNMTERIKASQQYQQTVPTTNTTGRRQSIHLQYFSESRKQQREMMQQAGSMTAYTRPSDIVSPDVMGRVNYSVDTRPNTDHLVFGRSLAGASQLRQQLSSQQQQGQVQTSRTSQTGIGSSQTSGIVPNRTPATRSSNVAFGQQQHGPQSKQRRLNTSSDTITNLMNELDRDDSKAGNLGDITITTANEKLNQSLNQYLNSTYSLIYKDVDDLKLEGLDDATVKKMKAKLKKTMDEQTRRLGDKMQQLHQMSLSDPTLSFGGLSPIPPRQQQRITPQGLPPVDSRGLIQQQPSQAMSNVRTNLRGRSGGSRGDQPQQSGGTQGVQRVQGTQGAQRAQGARGATGLASGSGIGGSSNGGSESGSDRDRDRDKSKGIKMKTNEQGLSLIDVETVKDPFGKVMSGIANAMMTSTHNQNRLMEDIISNRQSNVRETEYEKEMQKRKAKTMLRYRGRGFDGKGNDESVRVNFLLFIKDALQFAHDSKLIEKGEDDYLITILSDSFTEIAKENYLNKVSAEGKFDTFDKFLDWLFRIYPMRDMLRVVSEALFATQLNWKAKAEDMLKPYINMMRIFDMTKLYSHGHIIELYDLTERQHALKCYKKLHKRLQEQIDIYTRNLGRPLPQTIEELQTVINHIKSQEYDLEIQTMEPWRRSKLSRALNEKLLGKRINTNRNVNATQNYRGSYRGRNNKRGNKSYRGGRDYRGKGNRGNYSNVGNRRGNQYRGRSRNRGGYRGNTRGRNNYNNRGNRGNRGGRGGGYRGRKGNNNNNNNYRGRGNYSGKGRGRYRGRRGSYRGRGRERNNKNYNTRSNKNRNNNDTNAIEKRDRSYYEGKYHPVYNPTLKENATESEKINFYYLDGECNRKDCGRWGHRGKHHDELSEDMKCKLEDRSKSVYVLSRKTGIESETINHAMTAMINIMDKDTGKRSAGKGLQRIVSTTFDEYSDNNSNQDSYNSDYNLTTDRTKAAMVNTTQSNISDNNNHSQRIANQVQNSSVQRTTYNNNNNNRGNNSSNTYRS